MPRPRTARDTDVLTRAMFAFWQHGHAGSNVRRLEQATGLKASSLYHRFGSKDGLYAAALEHYLGKVVQWRIDRYLSDPDPIHGLRRFLESSYEYIDVERNRPPMACLLSNTALEMGSSDPNLAGLVNRGLQMVESAFASALARAAGQGRLRPDADVPLLARQLALGFQGILVSSRVRPDKAWLQQNLEALLAALPLLPPTPTGSPHEGTAHPR